MRARLCLALTVVCFSAAAGDDGFVPLVKGNDPAQFELVKIKPESMAIQDGEIRLTGKPNGYFATRDVYRNYVLRFDWMYERPEKLASDARFDGNSGLLIHIQAPHKVWPQSIEVQLLNSDAGHIFAIFGSKFQGKKDAQAQKKAIKPVGQWNHEEVTCQDGKVTCKINGIEVDRGQGASPDRGYIGWQSEGGPIRFRNLAIKKLD
jgi:3-keto-disaccharide hydrolase